MFGQMDACITGRADGNTPPQPWSLGNKWNNTSSTVPHSDLFYATQGQVPRDFHPFGPENPLFGLEPAVYGLDMGYITDLDFFAGITVPDNNFFDGMRAGTKWPFGQLLEPVSGGPTTTWNQRSEDLHVELVKQIHRAGGIVTFGWHLQNPSVDTNSFTWSLGHGIAPSLAPGSAANLRLNQAIDQVARFAKRCVDDSVPPKTIPILFRPFHEMNLNYFWWGSMNTPDEYKELFHYVVDRLRVHGNPQEQGVRNLIFVYSPNMESPNLDGTLGTYAPNSFQIVGLDAYPNRFSGYGYDPPSFALFEQNMKDVIVFAKEHIGQPLVALTEFGLMNLRRFTAPFDRNSIQNGTILYRDVYTYWTTDFLPELINLFAGFRAEVNGEMQNIVPEISYVMLWKNTHQVDAAITAAFINGKLLNANDSDFPAIPPVTIPPTRPTDGLTVFQYEEPRNEYYGTFKGHPSEPDFIDMLTKMTNQIIPNRVQNPKLFFRDDII